MTYTLDDIYSQLNEIKLMMAENNSNGWEDKKAEGLYASAIGKGANAGGSRIVNLINNINAALGYTKTNLRGIYDHIQHMVEPWAKADEAASKYAKTIAMTAEGMRKLTKTSIENVVSQKIGIHYNVSTDELLKIQNDYAKAVGRGIRVDDTQQESLAAMHAVMNGKEIELAAAFENFGVSLNGVADHAGKMFADASKNGLSFEKYSDNVAKNIKIAQNYTFKNGLKGLESMAKKATAIKLDMGQVASFAEKVSTIEGAIDVASKLQVLGGSFAGIADPLGMLNEGLMDMEGLTDRVIKMIGGMGAFNKQTGEVEVSAFNKQRIKAAAQAMGMDYSQLMESVNAGAKREEITRQISASANATGLDDKMKELLKNSATFENGKAGVSINGKFKTLDDLTNEDYKDLVKETQDQAADIKDIAKDLRSIKDMEQGTKKQYEAMKARMAKRWGLGSLVKGVVGFVGAWNLLLWVVAHGSWIKSILGMVGNGANLIGGWKNIFSGKRWHGDKSIFANRIGASGIFSKLGGKFGGIFSKLVGKFGGIIGKLGSIVGKFGGISGKFANKIGTKLISQLFSKTGGKVLTTAAGKTFTVAANGVMRNASGKVISGAARQKVLQSASKLASTTEKSAKFASALNISKNIRKTKQAVKLIKAGKAGKVIASGVKTVGKKVPIVGGLIAGGIEAFENKDKFKDRATRGEAVGKTAGAAVGAAAGAAALAWIPVVGPLVGGVVGEFLGKHIGGFIGKIQGNRVKKNRDIVDKQLSKYGIERKGDYSVRELKKIDEALQTGKLSNKMRKKLIKDGDADIVEKIEEIGSKKKQERTDRKSSKSTIAKSIKDGMFKVGVAYINAEKIGGNGILGKGINPKLGFGITNKASHFGGIGENFGLQRIKGKPKTGISNIKGLPEEGFSSELAGLKKSAERFEQKKGNGINQQQSESQNSLNGGKIDLNISGTIKLEGANGKQVDITKDLLKDSNFIREITKLITQRIGENQVGSNRQDNNNMARTI